MAERDETQHGLGTPYSLKTPHKLPYSLSQPDDETQLIELTNLVNSLYPTGRAFYRPKNGVFENVHNAVNVSFLRVIQESINLIDSSIPDNDNFNEENAEYLEYQYGLSSSSNVSLELRKSALRRKIGHPNNLKARQSKNFIEAQLRLAGFDVRVYENTPPYKSPSDVANLVVDETQHGGDTQHSDSTYHGGVTFEVIANKIDSNESYGIGTGNEWASFFIGGEQLGETATVSANRQREFRELVLKLKPAHLAAYIFINFT